MRNLLGSDLTRFRKDKLFIWILLLAVIFAILIPLTQWLPLRNMDAAEMSAAGFGLKNIFFYVIDINGYLCSIVPILIAVILFKDFSQGTIRNKLIAGTSRTSVFFSTYLTALIWLVCITMLHVFIALGLGLLLAPAQKFTFVWKDFGYLLGSVGLALNLYLFVAALIAYICVSSKNICSVVLKYLGLPVLFTLVLGLIVLAITSLNTSNNSILNNIGDFLENINIYQYSAVIGKTCSYETKELIYMIATPPALSALLMLLGWNKLRRKNIK